MLGRHMFGYAPSLVIPGLLSFAAVYFLTRLLPPAAYGHYTLAVNVMAMLLGVWFFWLQSAASRLLPEIVAQGRDAQFTATLYALYTLSALGLVIVAALIIALFPLGDWRVAAWFAPPLAILRALLNLNQAFHRTFLRIARYNFIEIGQAVLGFVAALFLIVALHKGAAGAALGTITGLAVMALVDWRLLTRLRLCDCDAGILRDILHFGLPFILNYGLSFIVARSDSFLIQIFCGAADVGIYNAGYAFPDRIGQYIFMAVATASLPLTVRRLEQEGAAAARAQTYDNGVAVLALALPAGVGLLFANHAIVTLLIGADFRAGALRVMPWITVAMMLNGFAAHYFDHAFHLAKKTRLFFYTLGPAAALNLAGNMALIPRYGYIAAAWTTVASYALYLALSILVGRRAFRVHFPFKPAAYIAFSTGFMALVLSVCRFPETPPGLGAMIVIGSAVYGTGLAVFDVMGARRRILARIWRQKPALPVTGACHLAILTDARAVAAIGREWQALYESAGQDGFGSYDWHQIWWRCLGQKAGDTWHVVTARASSGELRAVLPLAVRRVAFLRVAQRAGHEVFDYGDVVAADGDAAAALWGFVLAQGCYDVVLCKDMRAESSSVQLLARVMRARAQRKNYFLTLDFPSGEAWLAAQSRKLRGDTRRKVEKMQARGTVAFNLYRHGDIVPVAIIDALYRQKSAWFAAHKARGVFSRPEVRDFLHQLAQDAARRGVLYLAWLSCGDAIVACHMGFVHGGVLQLYHTSYDDDYAAFSPGNIIMIETIKAAIDSGRREIDFMRGDEAYKARFAGGVRVLNDYIAARSWLGKSAVFVGSFRKAPPMSGQIMNSV